MEKKFIAKAQKKEKMKNQSLVPLFFESSIEINKHRRTENIAVFRFNLEPAITNAPRFKRIEIHRRP